MISCVRTYFVSELMLHTKMCNVQTYVTHENDMSEPMLHAKILCLVSEFILYTKMCNARTHVAHENMMSRVRTYVTYKMCNFIYLFIYTIFIEGGTNIYK